MSKPTDKSKPRVDWKGMQPAWQAGIVPVAQLAREYKVSRAGIQKHWENLGIERDLSGKIAAQANAIVARQEVAAKRLQEKVASTNPVTEAETVTTNAEMQASVILAQRKDVARAVRMVVELFDELDAPEKGKTLTLPVRIESTRKLVETLKTAVGLQRQVLNIVDDTPVDPAKRMAEAVENGIAGLRAAFDKKLGRA